MQTLNTIRVFDKQLGDVVINEREFNAGTQEKWDDYEARLRQEKLEAELRAAKEKVAAEAKVTPKQKPEHKE